MPATLAALGPGISPHETNGVVLAGGWSSRMHREKGFSLYSEPGRGTLRVGSGIGPHH